MGELTDQEKSVMLARAMGWTISPQDVGVLFRPDESERWIANLYAPAHMALAWRVLNWVTHSARIGARFDIWFSRELHGLDFLRYKPADAQRAWLDKILQLAIEAGIVEHP